MINLLTTPFTYGIVHLDNELNVKFSDPLTGTIDNVI